jgi:hypothetical protein
MTERAHGHSLSGLVAALVFGAAAVAGGCQGKIGEVTGGGGSGGGIIGPMGTGGTGNTGGVVGACTGDPVVTPKRIVRLSFNQIASSVRAMFTTASGATVGTAIGDKILNNPAYSIVDAAHRWFPPLSNPREGSVLIDTVWQTGDNIGKEVAQYVFDNFTTVSKCPATPTDACAQTFVRALAEAGYRRPLTAEETTDINKVYTDSKGFGATIQRATQFAVWAIVDAPQFLYRTELGDDWMMPGALSPYELASAISYFLTDGPPDAMLLQAAAQNMLSTTEQVRAHVDRILMLPAGRANLEGAMMSYFRLTTIETIQVDGPTFPAFNEGVRNSMYRETEEFIKDNLWMGKVTDLLTTRRGRINTTLAPIYGVPNPPGATSEADFISVELPPERAGILTRGGFLMATARPRATSVVARGLQINEAILCNVNPAFPEELSEEIDAVTVMLEGKTEREKAAYRADKAHACAACHPSFDPYGLALENYNAIGQWRTADEMGRPIDASVTLPPSAGGATVPNGVAMAAALANGGAFATCIAKNMLRYALAETSTTIGNNSCATRAVTDKLAASDGSFTSLVREVALSRTLAARAAGGAQ